MKTLAYYYQPAAFIVFWIAVAVALILGAKPPSKPRPSKEELRDWYDDSPY